MSFFESLRHGVREYVTSRTYDPYTDPDLVSADPPEIEPTHPSTSSPVPDGHTATVHSLLSHIDGETPTGKLAALAGEHNGSVSRNAVIASGMSPRTIELLTAQTEFFHPQGELIEVVSFQKRAINIKPLSPNPIPST